VASTAARGRGDHRKSRTSDSDASVRTMKGLRATSIKLCIENVTLRDIEAMVRTCQKGAARCERVKGFVGILILAWREDQRRITLQLLWSTNT
jgi:hypothetical protein